MIVDKKYKINGEFQLQKVSLMIRQRLIANKLKVAN